MVTGAMEFAVTSVPCRANTVTRTLRVRVGDAARRSTIIHRYESRNCTSTLVARGQRSGLWPPAVASKTVAYLTGLHSGFIIGPYRGTAVTRRREKSVNRRTKIAVGIAAGAVVLAVAGIGVAAAGGYETPVTGSAADQARGAATQAVPGGKPGEVDQETGEGAAFYGVKVTQPDGTAVEVPLDQNFRVLGTQPVSPGGDDE
jgi:hypothetical protein